MEKSNKTTNSIHQSLRKIRVFTTGLVLSFVMISGIETTAAEGITVHGNWVVTVTNPDGSIAQQRVFQNALTAGGQSVLVGVLASPPPSYADGIFYPDYPLPWEIEVDTTGTTDSPECNAFLFSLAVTPSPLVEATVSAAASAWFTLSRNLALPESCIPGASYAVNTVRSAMTGQSSSGGTKFGSRATFTEKTLAAPVTGILPDQVVTLKVTFSFN